MASNPATQPRFVPAWPITRRLRSLTHFGFSTHDFAAFLDCNRTTVTHLLMGRQSRVRREIDTAARDLWERWSNEPVAEQQPLWRRYNWPVPWEWDDIDDPDEDPTPDSLIDAAGTRYLLRSAVQECGSRSEVYQQVKDHVSWQRFSGLLGPRKPGKIYRSRAEAIQTECLKIRSRYRVALSKHRRGVYRSGRSQWAKVAERIAA